MLLIKSLQVIVTFINKNFDKVDKRMSNWLEKKPE